MQSALARHFCTSRWLPDPTLWIPHTLTNISAKLCVPARGSGSKGAMLVLALGYKSVFMLELACCRELEKLWSGADPTACGICLLLQSCTDQVSHNSTTVGAQVPSGARLVRALSRTEHSSWCWVGGTHWSFGSYSAVIMFRYFTVSVPCFAFGCNSSLLPPSAGTTTSSDAGCQSLAHLVLLVLDLLSHLEAFQWRH